MVTANTIVFLASAAALVKSRRTDSTELGLDSKQNSAEFSPETVYHTSDFNADEMMHIAQIVDSLESLNILDSRTSTCLSLDQIQVSRSTDNQGAVQIGFQLRIREWTGAEDGSDINMLESDPTRTERGCFAGSGEITGSQTQNTTGNGTIIVPSSTGSSKLPQEDEITRAKAAVSGSKFTPYSTTL